MEHGKRRPETGKRSEEHGERNTENGRAVVPHVVQWRPGGTRFWEVGGTY